MRAAAARERRARSPERAGGVGPFDNAAIDAPDDGGWTALLVACAGPPGAKKEAGAARSGPDAAAVVRLLLDRGAGPARAEFAR